MTDVPGELMAHRPHLTLLQKTTTFVSWLMAGAIFLSVGWMAMEPDDPLGAVSFLTRRQPLVMLVEVVALAAVTSGLATVITARVLPDMGAFAASVGLAVVSVQGGTASFLLWENSAPGLTAGHGLAGRLILDSVGWFVVVLASVITSAAVTRWLFGPAIAPDESGTGRLMPAGYDLPGLGLPLGRDSLDQTRMAGGLKHLFVVAGVALLAYAWLCSVLYARAIQHGQACFSVAVSVWIATHVAHRVAPVGSALWGLGGVLLLAVGGFAWAGFRGPAEGLPAGIPPSHFLRVLPLQYVSVGTAAAIATSWSVRKHGANERVKHKTSPASERRTKPEGRRAKS